MLILTEKAVSAIEEGFATLAGVDELAAKLGVTKHHLIRVFGAETGLTPGGYITNTRIHYAKILLRHRSYSVETIAQMVGYSGANYFCKVFRRAEGKTPLAYRRGKTALPPLTPAEEAWIDTTDRLSYT